MDNIESGSFSPTFAATSSLTTEDTLQNTVIREGSITGTQIANGTITGAAAGMTADKIARNTIGNDNLQHDSVTLQVGNNTDDLIVVDLGPDATVGGTVPVFSSSLDGVVPRTGVATDNTDDHVLIDDGRWQKIEPWAISETALIPPSRIQSTGSNRGVYSGADAAAAQMALITEAERVRSIAGEMWQAHDVASTDNTGSNVVTPYLFLGYPEDAGTAVTIADNFAPLGTVEAYTAGTGLSLSGDEFSLDLSSVGSADDDYFLRVLRAGGSNTLAWQSATEVRTDLEINNVQNVNWTIPRMGVTTNQIDASHLPLAAGGNSGILRHDGTQNIGGAKTFINDVNVSGNFTTAGNTVLGNEATDEVTIRGLVEFENDGSATAPTIELSNSTMGAGIYAPAVDDIGFATSGVQRYGIKPNGDFVAVNASNTEDIIYDASTETIPVNRVQHSTVSATEPTISNRKEGDLWYDQSTNTLMVHNGTMFVSSVSGGSVSYANDPPTDASQGDLWYDCDDTGRIYVYTGNEWVDASPAGSEDIPATTTYSATAPTDPATGELWYDTDNSQLNVWDGTAWVEVSGGSGNIPDPPEAFVDSGWSTQFLTRGSTVRITGGTGTPTEVGDTIRFGDNGVVTTVNTVTDRMDGTFNVEVAHVIDAAAGTSMFVVDQDNIGTYSLSVTATATEWVEATSGGGGSGSSYDLTTGLGITAEYDYASRTAVDLSFTRTDSEVTITLPSAALATALATNLAPPIYDGVNVVTLVAFTQDDLDSGTFTGQAIINGGSLGLFVGRPGADPADPYTTFGTIESSGDVVTLTAVQDILGGTASWGTSPTTGFGDDVVYIGYALGGTLDTTAGTVTGAAISADRSVAIGTPVGDPTGAEISFDTGVLGYGLTTTTTDNVTTFAFDTATLGEGLRTTDIPPEITAATITFSGDGSTSFEITLPTEAIAEEVEGLSINQQLYLAGLTSADVNAGTYTGPLLGRIVSGNPQRFGGSGITVSRTGAVVTYTITNGAFSEVPDTFFTDIDYIGVVQANSIDFDSAENSISTADMTTATVLANTMFNTYTAIVGTITAEARTDITVDSDEVITVADLKTIVAASADFADFQTRIAAL